MDVKQGLARHWHLSFEPDTYGLGKHGDGQPQECPKFGFDAQLHVEGDTSVDSARKMLNNQF
jgi:hypothetical protein